MANTYLTRTFGAETNRKIWTWSAWVKRQNLVSDHQNALFAVYENTSNRSVFRFNAHQLNFQDTGNSVEIKTNRLFRDTSAWYHIVVRVDTTQATASDRVRIYVNGEQETSFATATYPNQNANMMFNNSFVHFINARQDGSIDSIADMSYSHIHFTDGTAYDATAFGEYDANGVWTIKTSPSVTYGTNGFFILKDGNSVTDQSGNSNNFTVAGGTLTNTEDSPSNVFATLNPLRNFSSMGSFSNGNNTYTKGNDGWVSALSTLGITSGKYYYEAKWVSGSYLKIGFCTDNGVSAIGHISETNLPGGYAWYTHDNGHVKTDNAVVSGWNYTDIPNITSISTGDIMKIAVDLDNKYAYFGVNDVWAKTNADPTSGASGTGGLDISSDFPSGTILFPAISVYNSVANVNFGNGYFGTTAVASAGTNASGNGIFEFDVPTGYTALSTKGLNL